MYKNFSQKNWKAYIPVPVYDENPEFLDFYFKAWEIAHEHIKHIDGMPQNPYMDEAFCDTQVWIWDSCFMALFCKFAREAFPGVETLKNFYGVLYGKKHLAKIVPGEKEPWWTGAVCGEEYEIKVHIADNPPLFAWAEYENALMSGDVNYVKTLLYEDEFLQKHYEWIESLHEQTHPQGVHFPTHLIAEKYGYKWEGGSSGMDNTPRGRMGEHAYSERPNNPDMLWVDAMCQQALSANIISKLYNLVGDKENATKWRNRFSEKAQVVNILYWDKEDAFYYDVDCNSHEFYKVMTIASYWAMTAEIATKEQSEKMMERLHNPENFGGIMPFTSLSRNDNDYNPNGGYWRGSVWLPTAYATLKGILNYGYFEDARSMAKNLLKHMQKTYSDFEPHTIWECYSPEEYKPATREDGSGDYVRKDFCGWSALGPISILIEFVLGFYKIDAFEKKIEWSIPEAMNGEIGIKNLRFGNIVTDITAVGNSCYVKSSDEYTLVINNKEYFIKKGENTLNYGGGL